MPIRVAVDYRPALLSATGIARATRELVRALGQLATSEADAGAHGNAGIELHLFAHSLARARIQGSAANSAAEGSPAEDSATGSSAAVDRAAVDRAAVDRAAVAPSVRMHRLPIPGRSLPLLRRLGLGADRLAGRAHVFHHTDYVQPPVSRARTLLTVHDLAFVRDTSWHGEAQARQLRNRTARAIATATAIAVPSQATARDVQSFFPEAPPTTVIPFGADHVPRGPHHRPPPPDLAGRRYALCVGTIEPRKNHLTLLRAWRQLPAPKPLLVVVGGIGWACADILAELQAAVDEGIAQWRTAAGDAELWSLLAHADLLTFPSLWEGFGFPPLEAMALGVPVIANDCAPMQELGDGSLGLTDARDVNALAAAIEHGLEDKEWRDRARAEGRRRATCFRWQTCAEQHAELYRELARQPR